MFSRKEKLLKKTGENGVGRYEYLKQLINEYTTTRDIEPKRQTLANLANFAYDPINYEFFKQLHVVDLFVAQLTEDHEDLVHFALAGICNVSPVPAFREHIISLNGIYRISSLLNSKNIEILLNAMTTLYYLTTPENTAILINDTTLNRVKRHENSSNKRLQNISVVCLKKWQELSEN